MLETKGKYKGFNYFVFAQPIGHRCGYVEIPKGHNIYGKDYDDDEVVNLGIHGGITYSSSELKHQKNGWYIGFDCAHYGDGKDLNIIKYKEVREEFRQLSDGYKIWQKEDVVKELKQLIKQLIK